MTTEQEDWSAVTPVAASTPLTMATSDTPTAAAPAPKMIVSSFAGIFLIRHTSATGGLLTVRNESLRLTPIQFDLLTLLLKQAMEDVETHELVRGFVSSYELLCNLPWDTAHPDIDHLKQLVRRVRRRLNTTGVVLQSRCGFGYRLLAPES